MVCKYKGREMGRAREWVEGREAFGPRGHRGWRRGLRHKGNEVSSMELQRQAHVCISPSDNTIIHRLHYLYADMRGEWDIADCSKSY